MVPHITRTEAQYAEPTAISFSGFDLFYSLNSASQRRANLFYARSMYDMTVSIFDSNDAALSLLSIFAVTLVTLPFCPVGLTT